MQITRKTFLRALAGLPFIGKMLVAGHVKPASSVTPISDDWMPGTRPTSLKQIKQMQAWYNHGIYEAQMASIRKFKALGFTNGMKLPREQDSETAAMAQVNPCAIELGNQNVYERSAERKRLTDKLKAKLTPCDYDAILEQIERERTSAHRPSAVAQSEPEWRTELAELLNETVDEVAGRDLPAEFFQLRVPKRSAITGNPISGFDVIEL